MNYFERLADRLLRKAAWKSMSRKDHKIYTSTIEKDIRQYRWIIKDSEENVIYDSNDDDYKGLHEYPVVYESLEVIRDAKRAEIKGKTRRQEKTSVVFHIDSNLWSIFPTEAVESMCVA